MFSTFSEKSSHAVSNDRFQTDLEDARIADRIVKWPASVIKRSMVWLWMHPF